jgi:hypothetical protein
MTRSVLSLVFAAFMLGIVTPGYAQKISADRRNSEIRYYEFGTCIAKKREVQEQVAAYREGKTNRGFVAEFDMYGFGDCLNAGAVMMQLKYQRLNYVVTPNLYRMEYSTSPPPVSLPFGNQDKEPIWACVVKDVPLDVHEALVVRIRSKLDDTVWDRLATAYSKCGNGTQADVVFDRERLRNLLARGIFYERLSDDWAKR